MLSQRVFLLVLLSFSFPLWGNSGDSTRCGALFESSQKYQKMEDLAQAEFPDFNALKTQGFVENWIKTLRALERGEPLSDRQKSKLYDLNHDLNRGDLIEGKTTRKTEEQTALIYDWLLHLVSTYRIRQAQQVDQVLSSLVASKLFALGMGDPLSGANRFLRLLAVAADGLPKQSSQQNRAWTPHYIRLLYKGDLKNDRKNYSDLVWSQQSFVYGQLIQRGFVDDSKMTKFESRGSFRPEEAVDDVYFMDVSRFGGEEQLYLKQYADSLQDSYGLNFLGREEVLPGEKISDEKLEKVLGRFVFNEDYVLIPPPNIKEHHVEGRLWVSQNSSHALEPGKNTGFWMDSEAQIRLLGWDPSKQNFRIEVHEVYLRDQEFRLLREPAGNSTPDGFIQMYLNAQELLDFGFETIPE